MIFAALHALFASQGRSLGREEPRYFQWEIQVGYIVKEEILQFGAVKRRGPFVTEQEARMVLANAVEQAYDFDPQLATANVRQKVEDAVRGGGWTLRAQSVLVCAFARPGQRRSRRPRRYGVNSTECLQEPIFED